MVLNGGDLAGQHQCSGYPWLSSLSSLSSLFSSASSSVVLGSAFAFLVVPGEMQSLKTDQEEKEDRRGKQEDKVMREDQLIVQFLLMIILKYMSR